MFFQPKWNKSCRAQLRLSLPTEMRQSTLLFLLLLVLPIMSMAQEDDYFDDSYLRYEDRTYQKSVKTVQFHIRNVPMSLPVIKLGSNEELLLRFDDLNAEYQDYTYTIIHTIKYPL